MMKLLNDYVLFEIMVKLMKEEKEKCSMGHYGEIFFYKDRHDKVQLVCPKCAELKEAPAQVPQVLPAPPPMPINPFGLGGHGIQPVRSNNPVVKQSGQVLICAGCQESVREPDLFHQTLSNSKLLWRA